jgi:peptide/nickel transport system permease protein
MLIKYILKRLVAMIPVLFGSLTLTFILSRFMPGDPVLAFMPQGCTARNDPELYHYFYRQLKLDQPILVQYFYYLGGIFSGNWGKSYSISYGQDVWTLVMQRLPRTIDLSILAIFFATLVGLKTGIISAKSRNKSKDTIIRGMSLLGVSIPVFYLGVLLQYTLAYQLPLFPATGFKTMDYDNPTWITGFRLIDSLITGQLYLALDYLYHLILPVFCLSFISLAAITRHTRSSMLEVIDQDYIRTARAKGCREKDVIKIHAKKNALIPVTTVVGLSLAGLLGGAVLTETTFNFKGMGHLLVDSITNSDYWTLNAVVFVITLIFIFSNLSVDLIYAMLDPRIRYD